MKWLCCHKGAEFFELSSFSFFKISGSYIESNLIKRNILNRLQDVRLNSPGIQVCERLAVI